MEDAWVAEEVHIALSVRITLSFSKFIPEVIIVLLYSYNISIFYELKPSQVAGCWIMNNLMIMA